MNSEKRKGILPHLFGSNSNMVTKQFTIICLDCAVGHEWEIPIEEVFQGYIQPGTTFPCPICNKQSCGYRPVWTEEYPGQIESIKKSKDIMFKKGGKDANI